MVFESIFVVVDLERRLMKRQLHDVYVYTFRFEITLIPTSCFSSFERALSVERVSSCFFKVDHNIVISFIGEVSSSL